MTLPEVLFWQAVRRDRLGVRIRRQHPVGPYILDFYCEPARLAIEIDGQVHDHPAKAAHDRRRTAWLGAQGIAVLRIPAKTILDDLNGVLDGLSHRFGR
jgi:very-short-patch-repair endonuclease